jgi:hypothetical protein
MGCFIIESWKINKNHKINGQENENVLCNDSTINTNNVQVNLLSTNAKWIELYDLTYAYWNKWKKIGKKNINVWCLSTNNECTIWIVFFAYQII